jgi:hypothetical protein
MIGMVNFSDFPIPSTKSLSDICPSPSASIRLKACQGHVITCRN